MTIQELEDKGLLLFKAYRGSKAYGTFIEGKSDLDEVIIYMKPLDELLSLRDVNQVNENNNDTVGYELGRFMQLLQTSNPTVCETLWSPDDCILYKHPIMDRLIAIRDTFLSKQMKKSFGGYAIQQIRKADGLNKMMNWDKEQMTRKGVLDFVYTNFLQGSTQIEKWLDHRGLKQEYCGLSAIPNMRYTYGLYYDYAQHLQRENVEFDSDEFHWLAEHLDLTPTLDEYELFLKHDINFKYKGIVQDVVNSNDVSLSSIPKGEKPLCVIQANLDGYTQHCTVYKQYLTWQKNHNKARYVDVENHGQKIDGKNMLHCVRLLRMSHEIATGKGLNIRRPDAEYLLEIRHGKHDLKKLKDECEEILKQNDKLFDESDLPATVDFSFMSNLLVQMRKEFYGLENR